MDPVYELSFRPTDDLEHRAFEGALHEFVAREADKPKSESSSVFAQYDAPEGRWTLAFETPAAHKAFSEFWRDQAGRSGRPSRPSQRETPWWASGAIPAPQG